MNTKRFTLSAVMVVTGLFSGSQLLSMSGLERAQTENKIKAAIAKVDENASLFKAIYDNSSNQLGVQNIKSFLNNPKVLFKTSEEVINLAQSAKLDTPKIMEPIFWKDFVIGEARKDEQIKTALALMYFTYMATKAGYEATKNLIAKLNAAGLNKIADSYNNQLVQVYTPFSLLTK